MESSEVTACPHEGDGAYIVEGCMWKVGIRYELLKVLGKGSFSVVCLARDKKTGEHVAVKKIRDVFVHKHNAKNVMREVYIQRRLRHPNVVQLMDLFMMPSPTGRWKMVKGKLVSDSVDLYLVMEYMDGGDLFHMSEQLNEQEVRDIMDQLLLATQFLHSCGVIHRDIKSANILVKTNRRTGRKIVKLGDFGCARSSNTSSSVMERNTSFGSLETATQSEDNSPSTTDNSVTEVDMVDMGAPSTSGAGAGMNGYNNAFPFGGRNGGGGNGMKAIMTTAVATPCYRAPEVVMSLESYNSTIDIWSIGCIFAELLARLLSQLKGYCKHLRVVPLFNLTDQPRLYSGVNWDDGEGETEAHRELSTVFDVIGTPPWAHVEKITDQRWKKFLQCLPGHAPNLMRRFPGLSEVCLDLLRRMLEFDPESRCSASEALSHEYLADIQEMNQDIRGEVSILHSKDKEAFQQFEIDLESLLKDTEDTHALKLKEILEKEFQEHKHLMENENGKNRWKPVDLDVSMHLSKVKLFNTSSPVLDKKMFEEDANEEMNNSYNTNTSGAQSEKGTNNLWFEGRHKDWTSTTSCTVEPHWSTNKPAEPVWGVSTVAPGMENKQSNSIISQQQSR